MAHGNIYGQNENDKASSKAANYTIGLHPSYLMNGGMRIDLDKKLSPDKWLQFTATGYFMNNRSLDGEGWSTPNSYYDYFSSLKGAGLGAAYKSFFMSRSTSTPRFYVSTGLYYTHYNVSYPGRCYESFTEDGLTYWRYKVGNRSIMYNKLNTNICLGFQNPAIKKNFFIDFYLGIGYSYSFFNQNDNPFDTGVFSFGYRGIEPVGGLRMGFAF